jgi:hypothetical protein
MKQPMSVRIANVTRLAMLCVVVAALFGCGSGNKLIGNWTNPQGDFVESLKPDGTFAFDYDNAGSRVKIDGTWTYEGTTLHLVPKTLSVTGGTDAEAKKAQIETNVMKVTDWTLLWSDDDHFITQTKEGNQAQWQRRK